MRAVADGDPVSLEGCARKLLPFFPFRLTEEALRPIYVTLLRYAREGRSPVREEELAAALIFKELGFFHPVPNLEPVPHVQRRSCTESKLFMALSTR